MSPFARYPRSTSLGGTEALQSAIALRGQCANVKGGGALTARTALGRAVEAWKEVAGLVQTVRQTSRTTADSNGVLSKIFVEYVEL